MIDILGVAIVIITVLSVILIEHAKFRSIQFILKWVPAILFAYIIPAAITHLFDLDMANAMVHKWSTDIIMPLAIIFVMSALSFRQLKIVGYRPILVFISGSAGVALMPFILLPILSLFTDIFQSSIIDQEYWQGMVTMVGSWIGGSTSQLILKEISGCPEGLFLIILIMDNVLVNLWTIFMFQKIKRSDRINQALRIDDPIEDFIPDEVDVSSNTLGDIVLTLSIAIATVILSYFIIESFLLKVVALSLVGLALGNFLSFWNHTIMIKAGGYLIITIMAILGLKLNFSNFSLPAAVLVFSVIWLVSHYVIMMITAYLLKLNMAWVPIASMANVGGISTAPAVTKAYNEEWMPHAILLAILSMVTGTYWGMLTIYLFEVLY